MKIIGATINLITTAAFVVALGMIVDGSIVMLEQSSRYLGKPGTDSDSAIFKGSDEVGASIVASVIKYKSLKYLDKKIPFDFIIKGILFI